MGSSTTPVVEWGTLKDKAPATFGFCSKNLHQALVNTFGDFPRVLSENDSDIIEAMSEAANEWNDKETLNSLFRSLGSSGYCWVKLSIWDNKLTIG